MLFSRANLLPPVSAGPLRLAQLILAQNPWGAPPPGGPPPGGGNGGNFGGNGGRGPGDRGPGDRGPGDRGPGGRGPGGRGPGGWPPGGNVPDLDALIAAAQGWLRGVLPGRGGNLRMGGLGALVLIALWLSTGFYRVQPDELGVVMRFGAFTRTTPPGLNYHLPWPIETVALPAVTRINRTDIGYRSDQLMPGTDSAAREVPAESLMLTGDENIIDINFAVFWRISDASAFLFNTRNPQLTVKYAAESVMREVIGSTPIQPALAEARARIEAGVMSGAQAILDQYKAGVEITQVQLQRVDPPAAVIDSFRDVQRANTDADRLRNEAQSYANDIIPRARGEAARLVAEADGARQATIAEAAGEAQRFASVDAAYQAAREVTLRRLYIEAMENLMSRNPPTVIDPQLRGILPMLPGASLPLAAPVVASEPPQAPPPPLPGPRSTLR